jgi:hypothetical protein
MVAQAHAVPCKTFPMTSGPEATVPWWRRYFLFENWAWSDPQELAVRRTGWSAWRRAVRPIGAIVWWLGAAWGIIWQPTWRTMSVPLTILGVTGLAVVGLCVLIGVIDGFRHRRAHPRPPSERHGRRSAAPR